MACSSDFVQHIADQCSGAGEIVTKKELDKQADCWSARKARSWNMRWTESWKSGNSHGLETEISLQDLWLRGRGV